MAIDLLAEDTQHNTPIDLLADEEVIKNNEPKGFLRNALNYEKGLGLGLAQGAGDVLSSIGNYPSDIYKYFTGNQPYHIPHPSLQQYYPEGTASKVGSSIGETIGSFAAPGGSVFKALRGINNPVYKALMGAGAGGLVGSASNEEDRVGAGITGAALGGGGALAGSLIKGLGGLTSSGIAKKISADKLEAKKMANKEYNALFAEAANKGIDKVKIPDINAKRIISNSLPRYHEALLNFKNNPTVETAHWAQSDLGHLRRQLEKLDASRGLTSTEHKTYKDVIEAQNKLKDAMFSTSAQKHPESIFETYESGDLFGVTANPKGTFLPGNSVGMAKRGDRAIVIDSKVESPGQGLGKDLYRKAIETSQKKGLQFESDDVVSESAMNVYKSLEKEGYKFKYNSNIEKIKREDGQIAYKAKKDDEPVVKLISSPSNAISPLKEKYNQLSSKYKETVVPYDELKQLRNYEAGKLLPKDLVEHLKNNKEFKATLMKKYPQININQLLKSKSAKTLSTALLAGLGLKKGWDLAD